jgi:class I fructose-bisphosphate aldolase
MTALTGVALRQSRIINPDTGHGIVVAMDHGLFLGPLEGLSNTRKAIEAVLPGGPDAIQLTPGLVRANRDLFSGRGRPAVVLRIDATNIWRKKPAPEPGYYAQVASVKTAVQLGADAVVTFLLAGHEDDTHEARNVEALSAIFQDCQDYGMPFIVEPLAIKKGMHVVQDVEIMRLVVRMASELGADLIKADYPGNRKAFAELVSISSAPILVRGGPKMERERDMLQMVKDAMEEGAAGLVFGRNIWQHKHPARILKALNAVVHENATVQKAMAILGR